MAEELQEEREMGSNAEAMDALAKGVQSPPEDEARYEKERAEQEDWEKAIDPDAPRPSR